MADSDGGGGSEGGNQHIGQFGLHEEDRCDRGVSGDGERAEGAAVGEVKSALGRDADGPTSRMGYAELFITTDNRTDELRSLGNGVVPATAERAFRELSKKFLLP